MRMTTTEFIVLPPCGDKITYEILMNSPHPIRFYNEPFTSFFFVLSELFILSPDYYIQMILHVKRKIIQNNPTDTG
jgi:hypothetical protein